MKVKKDIKNRYRIETDGDDTQLFLDIDKGFSGTYLGIYQGHKSSLINDKLESLDCTNWLTADDVDELIDLLMRCKIEMVRKVAGR